MDKVWAVTTGEYSDYQIRGIFAQDNEQMAREFAASLGTEPKAWPLNTWTQEQGEWEFRFGPAGKLMAALYTPHLTPEPAREPTACACHESGVIAITVYRGDREDALKIGSERYTRIRTYWDEAIIRLQRAEKSLGGYWNEHDVLALAQILAGLKPAPTAPAKSREHERLLLALRMASTPTVIVRD